MKESTLNEGALETMPALTGFMTAMVSELNLDITLEDAVLEDNSIYFNIQGQDAHFLLNHKAEAIKSMAFLLQTWLDHQDDANGLTVTVDAEGKLKRKEKELMLEVEDACAQLSDIGQELKLEPLNPYDRRVIHIKMRESEQFVTESVGSGHLKSILIRRIS